LAKRRAADAHALEVICISKPLGLDARGLVDYRSKIEAGPEGFIDDEHGHGGGRIPGLSALIAFGFDDDLFGRRSILFCQGRKCEYER